MIEFKCQCGAQFEVDDEFAGQKCVCDMCGERFLVPSPSDAPDTIPGGASSDAPHAAPQEEEATVAEAFGEGRERAGNARSVEATPAERADANPPAPQVAPRKKSKSPMLIVLLALLFLGGGGILYMLSRGNAKPPEPTIHLEGYDQDEETSAPPPSTPAEPPVVHNSEEPPAMSPPAMVPPPKTLSPIVSAPAKKVPIQEGKEWRPPPYVALVEKAPPEDALTAYFPFDGIVENKANPRASIRPLGNVGVKMFAPGLVGKALFLSRETRSTVDIPDTVLNAEAGTISVWVKFHNDFSNYWGQPIFALKSDKGKQIWSLDWNIHMCRIYSIFDDVKANHAASGYYRPSGWSWVNLTVTWDKAADKRALYVNGRLTSYYSTLKMPESGASPRKGLKLMFCNAYPKQRMGVDELRIYNKALSPAEVKWLVAEIAPIHVRLEGVGSIKRVVYGKSGSTKSWTTFVELTTGEPYKGRLKLETLDSKGKILWSGNAAVSLTSRGEKKELTWQVPIGGKSATCFLHAITASGGKRMEWGLKVARITSDSKSSSYPGIPSKALKKVYSVNCVSKPSSKTFYASKPTKVVKDSAGAYRETPVEPFSFFAYRFFVKHPGKPHVLRVYYPDNKPRVFALDVNDGTGNCPSGAGIMTGFQTPLSGRIWAQDVVFWPATENCLLIACNWSTAGDNRGALAPFKPQTGAAVAKFEVFEVGMDLLPKLPLSANGVDSGRTVGVWVEDSGQTEFWGTSRKISSGLEGWIVSSERMAEYMDFVGINEYQYPVVWYDGELFRSPTLEAFNGPSPDRTPRHPSGAFDILLSVFQKRGIKFFPSLYLRDLAALFSQTDAELPNVMADRFSKEIWAQRYRGPNPGGNDMFQFLKNGKFRVRPYGGSGVPGSKAHVGPEFNPLHPAVQKVMLGMYKDWLKQYGKYPALGGVLLDLGLSWGGLPQADSYSFDRLFGGYGDFTVGLFEKATGVKVPGDPEDPERFAKRYKFLTSSAMRGKWIRWRCEQIRDKIVMPIYRLVKRTRPDLKLEIGIGSASSMDVGSPLMGADMNWMEAALRCGIDVRMYKGLKDVVFVRHGVNWQSITKCYPFDYLDKYWPSPPGFEDYGVSAITSSYWEMFSHGHIVKPVAKIWPEVKPNLLPVRTIVDARGGALAYAAQALQKMDIKRLYVSGTGNPATFGHERYVIPFFRAFRMLPVVTFGDVPGLSDPVRARWKNIDGKTFFYLVNASPVAVPVLLKFSAPPGKGVDLGRMKSIEVKKSECSVKMPPYSLRSFKFPGNFQVVSGKASVSGKTLAELKKRLLKVRRKAESGHPVKKPGKAYVGVEAEKFTDWPSNEKYFFDHFKGQMSSELKTLVSGGEVIGFGGGSQKVSYDINLPKPGRYTVWARFAMSAKPGKASKWNAEFNGGQLPEFHTPTDEKGLWVKVGSVDAAGGDAVFKIWHATVSYSMPIDCFLFTNDATFKPKGPIDYEKKLKGFKALAARVAKELNAGHIAMAKALLLVLEHGGN